MTFVGHQKYGDQVNVDVVLYGVMRGDVLTTHRESTTCDRGAKLDLYSFHVLMLICHLITPLLVAHGPLGPDDDQS